MCDHNLNRIKPAPIWLDDPALWFAHIEAQFWYYNVKDDLSKFNYIIAQLDKHCLTFVKDAVLSPPAENKYDTLKSDLLSKLKESKVNNIMEILKGQDMGDRKPSEFLNYLKELAGPDFDEAYLKSVWSSCLPVTVQWVSSFLTSSSLGKIAQLADLAMNSPAIKSPENKCEVSKKTDIKSETKQDDEMKELTHRVEDLTIKVDTMSSKPKTNETEEVTSKAKTSTIASVISQSSIYKTKIYKQPPLIICWYHAQFGFASTKCVQPCNFTVCSLNSLAVV